MVSKNIKNIQAPRNLLKGTSSKFKGGKIYVVILICLVPHVYSTCFSTHFPSIEPAGEGLHKSKRLSSVVTDVQRML